MSADEEEVTHSRVLTIEHTLETFIKSFDLFKTEIINKLDNKSDFSLPDTLKTVIATIVIVTAAVAGIDYRMDSKIALVNHDAQFRDKAILALNKNFEEIYKKVYLYETQSSNLKEKVEGNSAFIDHFQYTKEYPLKINTMQSDIKMLKYSIRKH